MTGPAYVERRNSTFPSVYVPRCDEHPRRWYGPATYEVLLATQNATIHNTDEHPSESE
ncbi:MAG: hypothetical protein ABI566_03660 [Pseudolysinimonas sp.]